MVAICACEVTVILTQRLLGSGSRLKNNRGNKEYILILLQCQDAIITTSHIRLVSISASDSALH